MGPVSITADRLGLSVRERTMFAASVVNAIGGDLDETNINRGSAWKQGQKARTIKAGEIKDTFIVPDRVAGTGRASR